MIKVENIDIHGFEAAIRGMRNPLNSWEKSDSIFIDWWVGEWHDVAGNSGPYDPDDVYFDLKIGPNDLDLMKRLYQAGTEHRKFMRMIMVTMDITAPLYWWKEFDTYKVGTVANSCSTMHKIAEKEFTLDDFSHEHIAFYENEDPTSPEPIIGCSTFIGDYVKYPGDALNLTIDMLNHCRAMYNKTKDKLYWWQLIQLLPSSYNQKRTVQMSYENVVTIIKQRKGHKLDEWHQLIDEFENLPYIKEITE